MRNLPDLPIPNEDKYLYFCYAQCRHCGRYVSDPLFTNTMKCDCGHTDWDSYRYEEPTLTSQWVGDLNEHMLRIAHSFGVHVVRDTDNLTLNHGACSGGIISLNQCISTSMEWLIFFHELGHWVSNTQLGLTRPTYFTKVSEEALAWEIGLQIAYEHGFSWESDSLEMMHAKVCFHTYNKPQNWGLPKHLEQFNLTPEEMFLAPTTPLQKWVYPPSYSPACLTPLAAIRKEEDYCEYEHE